MIQLAHVRASDQTLHLSIADGEPAREPVATLTDQLAAEAEARSGYGVPMSEKRAWLDDDRAQVYDEATREILVFDTISGAVEWVESQPFPGLTGHYQSSDGRPQWIVWVDEHGTRRFTAHCRRGL